MFFKIFYGGKNNKNNIINKLIEESEFDNLEKYFDDIKNKIDNNNEIKIDYKEYFNDIIKEINNKKKYFNDIIFIIYKYKYDITRTKEEINFEKYFENIIQEIHNKKTSYKKKNLLIKK